jgi:hypothetical protein
VKIGDGPAAVTFLLRYFSREENSFGRCASLFRKRNGKAAEREGSQKTCLELTEIAFADRMRFIEIVRG